MNEILMSFRRLLQAIVKQSLEDKKYICHIFVFFPFFPLYVEKKKKAERSLFFCCLCFSSKWEKACFVSSIIYLLLPECMIITDYQVELSRGYWENKKWLTLQGRGVFIQLA